MNKTVWELKASRHTLECDVCGTMVESVHWMIGRYALCPDHKNALGYLRAALARGIRR